MFSSAADPFALPLTVAGAASDIAFAAPATRGPAWEPVVEEGQLAVDVVETPAEVVIVAPLSGTRPEDIELHLHDDVLTIRGVRQAPAAAAGEYMAAECYWGAFSRTIVLPADVTSELAQAEYRHGLLTIRLPRAAPRQTIPILVVED